MVTVFSQQRPGRPRWALPVGLALLLGALGMAARLIAVKTEAQYVSLGPVGELPGELSGAVPEGWKVIPEADLPQGAVHGWVEPSHRRGKTARQLYLFHGISEPFALPSREGCQTLKLVARDAVYKLCRAMGYKLLRFDLPDRQFDPIGPFTGCTAQVESIVATEQGPSPYYHLGRVAVTPGGQVFGVLIETGRKPGRSDARLLDQVCEHLTVSTETLTSDVPAVMESAGFRFEPPPEVQAVVPGDDDLPHCLITQGTGSNTWYLDIYRVPLIEDRQPGDLLTDYATTALKDPEAPQEIASTRAGERELLSLALTPTDRREVRGFLWAMRTDARTAVHMRGRCEIDGEEGLQRFVRDFATEAEVASYEDQIEIAAARQTGRTILNDLAKEGLDALWSKYLDRAILYEAYSYGMLLGRESVLYNASESGNGWRVSKQIQFQNWGLQIRIDESWTVRDGGAAHDRELTQSLRGSEAFRPIVTTDYREIRIPGSERVDRHLIARSPHHQVRRSVRDQVEIDELYGCEPLLLEAAARMAIDPESRPAIFTTTEPYAAQRVYWILAPAGRAPCPGDPKGEPVNAVRLQFDYDPDPIMLYFDDQGMMVGHASHTGVYYVLTDDKEESEEAILR